jgi:hypothetical protein
MVMADVAEFGVVASGKVKDDAIGSIKSKAPYFVAFEVRRQSQTVREQNRSGGGLFQ